MTEIDKVSDSVAPPSQVAAAHKKKKKKPARRQVDPKDVTGQKGPPQTGVVWNIWYHKYSGGDREDPFASQTPADGRCVISRDSGYTRGDKIAGVYFCVFFAKGLCTEGPDCIYLHRLPSHHDIFNPNVDCFGRDKHADYRDDMAGVGSFLRQNHTLYVGKIAVTENIEEVVARHFAEWGEIERIRILNSRGIAFVTYALESSAQFAKEAMNRQSLDNNEIINIRWATNDPNPVALARDQRRVEEQAAEAIRRALPAEFVEELEGRSSKRGRGDERNLGLIGYEAPDDIWYARGEGAVHPAVERIENKSPLQVQPLERSQSARENQLASRKTLDLLAQLKDKSLHFNQPDRQETRTSPAAGLVEYGSEDDD